MEILKFILDNFNLNFDNILHGGEATVFVGSHSDHGKVAIKKWHTKHRDKDEEQRARREVTLIMQNKHKNIIEFLGILVDDKSEWIGYVMPYMAMGSLDEIIHNKDDKNYDDIYTSEQIKRWIVGICSGLSHLHSNNIIHRDINPNKRGTPFYMAPEIINGEIYDISVDIYSLSITIWEILHRRNPYDHIPNKFDLFIVVRNGKRPQRNNDLSKEVSDFLTRCWDANVSKRPTIDKVLEFYSDRELQITALEEFSTGNDESKNAQKSTTASKRVSNSHDSLYQTPLKKPNVQVQRTVEKSSEKQTILLLGGIDESNCDSVVMLGNNGENWKQLNIKLPYGFRGHAAQFFNNNLYIFGGENASGYPINFTHKLSKSLKWEKMADMNQRRTYISNSSVILNNQIWVCGGWNPQDKSLKSVEMYDPETNKWKYMKSMNENRLEAAAAVVNGKIFCSGGTKGWKEASNSVECYDPSSDVWTLICNMPQETWGHGAVEIDGNLIVIGGYNNPNYLNSVWALDKNAKWIEKPSMSILRSDFGIAKIDDKIFVCGGEIPYNNQTDSVEIFDGEVWRNGPNMPTSRRDAPAVVVPMRFARYLKWNKSFFLRGVELPTRLPASTTYPPKLWTPLHHRGIHAI